MGLIKNGAEGGTNGVTVTTANSGGTSGTALAQVTAAGTPTYVFSNTVSAHGTMSYHISGVSGDTAKLYLGATQNAQGAMRAYLYLSSLPSAAQALFTIQNSAFSNIAAVNISGANKLAVADNSGATLHTAPTALSASTWYRVEVQVVVGASTATGTLNFQYYALDSTTSIDSFSSTTANTGTTNALRLQFGKQSSTPTLDAYFDDIAYDDTTSTPIGVYSTSNILPTCSAGLDQTNIEPYNTMTLSGTDSDTDGTVASRQWRQVSGSPSVTLSGATTAACTYLAPGTISGTTLVFGYTVTDDLGGSSTESTVQHTILGASERAVIGGVEVPVETRVVSGGVLQ